MNLPTRFAFYGSLRRGMSNYRKFESKLHFVEQLELSGFQLFEMRYYPYAIQTGRESDKITVDIFEIADPVTARAIHALELSVGYHYAEVTIHGQATGIYLYHHEGGERLVEGGDWVKFFGNRQ